MRWKICSRTEDGEVVPAKLPAGSKLEIRALARQPLRLSDVSAWQTLVTLDAPSASGEWNLRGQTVINGWGPNPRPGSRVGAPYGIPYLKRAEYTAAPGFFITTQTDPAAPGLQQYALEPSKYLELSGPRIPVERGKTYAFCAWLSQPARLADDKKEVRLGLEFQDAEGKRCGSRSDRFPDTPAWTFRSITVTPALIQSDQKKISRYNMGTLPENAAWLLPELSLKVPCLIEAVYLGEIDPP